MTHHGYQCLLCCKLRPSSLVFFILGAALTLTIFSTLNGDTKQNPSSIATIDALIRDNTIFKSLRPLDDQDWTASSTDNSSWLFVAGAYLLHDRRILRLVVVSECTNNDTYHLTLSPLTSKLKAKTKSINYCPWAFNPKCDYVGKFLDVRLPQPEMNLLTGTDHYQILLSKSDELGFEHSTQMPRILHRNDLAPIHELGVCVQPAYYYAAWIQLIQFVQIWKQLGATKILFYVQSISTESAQIVDLFVSEGVLELVQWSSLPVMDNANVNDRVYRTEVVAAINDCVLRMRHMAKYVALVDLDEIVHAPSFPNLPEFVSNEMGRQQRKHKKSVACLTIRSSNTAFSLPVRFSQPQLALGDIDFDYLHNVSRETYVYPAGMRSKLICQPGLVDATHVHSVLRHSKLKTISVVVQSGRALVVHLRRVTSLVAVHHNQSVSLSLTKYTKPASASWKTMVKQNAGKLPKTLRNRGTGVMALLETCVDQIYKRKSQTCTSVYKCAGNITDVFPDGWWQSRQMWTVL